MNRKQKKLLEKIIISALLTLTFHFIPVSGITRFIIYLIPYLIVGYPILKKAIHGILNGNLFDENFLMAVATAGAMIIGITKTGDYTEAVAVMIFYQTGEFFQSYAVGKSRKNIAELMDIRPDTANIERNGEIISVSPDEIEPQSIIIVLPGEKIPIDGIVTEGKSYTDNSSLTGESLPVSVAPGDTVISGSINKTGLLKIKTTKTFGESTVSKILELVENAGAKKSRSEKFISRFSRKYTPVVCILAFLLAVIPPTISILFLNEAPLWSEWIYRALTFLVISCPCALVISIPLSFFSAVGSAGREGILIKGSVYLEELSKGTIAVFDKTGTLTEGSFSVEKLIPNNTDEETLLMYAALAEASSNHPIALSITKKYGRKIDTSSLISVTEIPGRGITAITEGAEISVGNSAFMKELGIKESLPDEPGTCIYISLKGKYLGCIVISDKIKPEAANVITSLRQSKFKKIAILTGDSEASAAHIGSKIKADEIHWGLLPEDKVSEVERLISQKDKNSTLIFLGDGINDAPVLTRADVGIAMGGIGSDAAIEAADIVIMDDNIKKLIRAIEISRKCMRIVYQNITFSLGVKFICLILGAMGLSDMRLAVFADVGVMIIAVLNSMRNFKKGR